MADIGIVGGTFDPIHNGHLLLGRQAFQEYHLQQVWFMPSGRPPHKKDHPVTDARRPRRNGAACPGGGTLFPAV